VSRETDNPIQVATLDSRHVKINEAALFGDSTTDFQRIPSSESWKGETINLRESRQMV
jgi:hypothetical protein